MTQAFGALSDKLQPLVKGVNENKEHWLQLAQNAQNRSNSCNTAANTAGDDSALVSTNRNDNENNLNNNNNNNTIVYTSRSPSLTSEDNIISNGTNSEIPKIVGKIGRLSSPNVFPPKQNGINCENFATRDHTQEAMDQ